MNTPRGPEDNEANCGVRLPRNNGTVEEGTFSNGVLIEVKKITSDGTPLEGAYDDKTGKLIIKPAPAPETL